MLEQQPAHKKPNKRVIYSALHVPEARNAYFLLPPSSGERSQDFGTRPAARCLRSQAQPREAPECGHHPGRGLLPPGSPSLEMVRGPALDCGQGRAAGPLVAAWPTLPWVSHTASPCVARACQPQTAPPGTTTPRDWLWEEGTLTSCPSQRPPLLPRCTPRTRA